MPYAATRSRADRVIVYGLAGAEPLLGFPDRVLAHFARHRQTRPWHVEAGGQLFATFSTGEIVTIERVTGPRCLDRRRRNSFVPNRRAEQREIRRLFKCGEHFVGDWHTHAEILPMPSGVDIASLQQMFTKSNHDLTSLVLVIVGTAPFPDGLFVALVTMDDVQQLQPAANVRAEQVIGQIIRPPCRPV